MNNSKTLMHINIKEIKAGKMTQWPRALSELAEDPGSVPGHTRKLTVLYTLVHGVTHVLFGPLHT